MKRGASDRVYAAKVVQVIGPDLLTTAEAFAQSGFVVTGLITNSSALDGSWAKPARGKALGPFMGDR